MARTSPATGRELFQDRRVQIAAAVIALLIIAAILFFALGQGGDDDAAAVGGTEAVPGVPGPEAFPGGPGGPGDIPGAGVPGGFPAATPGAAGAAPRSARPNSFSGAPDLLTRGGGTAAGGFGGGGFGGGGFGPPGGAGGGDPFGGGGAAPAASAPKPKPIVEGRKVADARRDPFVSFFQPAILRPPAYSFSLPIRLASYPRTDVDIREQDPNRRFGPLPYVPRRVAGVLYNGSVSAILETGNPGEAADVRVVRPGQGQIPSGVPGVPDLTVEAITPTALTLRAPDGRSVDVRLTGAPAGALGQAGGGFPGGGIPGGAGFPGGVPGGPPGGFPGGIPGGFPGGPRGGGAPADF